MHLLDKELTYLPGIGPKRANLLKSELGLVTWSDLLYYFPYRYIDKSHLYKIKDLDKDSPYIQVKGFFTHFELIVTGKQTKRLVGYFTDGTGVIDVVWFKGISWIRKTIAIEQPYILFGKPNIFGNKFNIVHPEIDNFNKWNEQVGNLFQPQYNTTDRLKQSFINSKTIQRFCNVLLKQLHSSIPETLPIWFVQKYNLLGLEDSLNKLHFPSSAEDISKAEYRIKFEELFYIQLSLQQLKISRKETSIGFVFDKKKDNLVKQCFLDKIPFNLTSAQIQVLREIRQDLSSGRQMNRLLQGDVGSGKTLVALLCLLMSVDNGYQACIMAPTEILAQQHYNSLKQYLDGLNICFSLLTSSVKKKDKVKILEQLEQGSLNILVGTHALIEDNVIFKNLGLVVIDEQHRFGVEQRAKLWRKNNPAPHILVMTATPIPRTLAMTIYGDLDISVIDKLPPGRSKIITKHFKDNDRLAVFGFIKKQISLGRQVYVVFPLINESENLSYKDLELGLDEFSLAFPEPEFQISVVHGRMKAAEKEAAMNLFKDKKTQIMIATTVIEVGVDVPNASVMIIESAEKFGLSQLHQLRGRVGRGKSQSYCILMTDDKLSDNAYQRIKTMVNSTDGFEIAEIDLKLRGPGTLDGKQQSGFDFNLKLADLSKDAQLIHYAKDIASEIITNDAKLSKNENKTFKETIANHYKSNIDYGIVS